MLWCAMVKQRKIVGIWPAPEADLDRQGQDDPLELTQDAMIADAPGGIAAPSASGQSVDPRSWLGDGTAESSVFDSHPVPFQRLPWVAIALSLLAAAWIVGVSWTATVGWQVMPEAAGLAQWIAILSMPLALLLLLWMAIERGSHATTVRHLRLLAVMRDEQQRLDERLAAIDGHWHAAQATLRERADDAGAAITASAQTIDAVAARLDLRMRDTVTSAGLVVTQGEIASRQIDGLMVALPKAEDVAQRTADVLQGAAQAAYQQGSQLEAQLAAVQSEAVDIERTVEAALSTLTARIADVQMAGQQADTVAKAASERFAAALDEQRVSALAMLADLAASLETSTTASEARLAEARAGLDRASSMQLAALSDGVAAAQARSSELDAIIARAADRSEALGAGLGESVSDIERRIERFAAETDTRLAALAAALQSTAGEIDALAGAGERNILTSGQMIERIETARAQFVALGDQIDVSIPQSLQKLDGEIEQVRANVAALPVLLDNGATGTAAMLDTVRQAERLLEEQAQQLAALDSGGRGMIAAQTGGVADLGQSIDALMARIAALKDVALPALADAVADQAEAATRSADTIETSIAGAADRSGAAVQRIVGQAIDAAAGQAASERLEQLAAVASNAVTAATQASERLMEQLAAITASSADIEARAGSFATTIQRADGESLVRQMALAGEALQSMSVDLTRVLDSDVSDQAWEAYLKGDRSIFARRAVRLLSASEARDILRRHGEDEAFRHLVNRYIHDFEAMLRRLIDAPEGDALTVTLLSSDIGKIYVVLAQAIERLRA